jgi:hypothetical protein
VSLGLYGGNRTQRNGGTAQYISREDNYNNYEEDLKKRRTSFMKLNDYNDQGLNLASLT